MAGRQPSPDPVLADPEAAKAFGKIEGKLTELVHIAAGDAQRQEAIARTLTKPEIPAPLKWAGAIVAALFTAGTATMAFWLVSSVSEMQVTLARMDERMAGGTVKDGRVDLLDMRVTKLEQGADE